MRQRRTHPLRRALDVRVPEPGRQGRLTTGPPAILRQSDPLFILNLYFKKTAVVRWIKELEI